MSRNSNIELLRIVLMIFVITLHYNGMSGHAMAFCNEEINFYFTRITESLSICAVNCFMIISGFFLAFNKEIKLKRIFHILGIVIGINFFTEFVYIAIARQFSIKSLIRCFLPENYFSTFYIITYILSPFINSVFDKIKDKKKTSYFISILIALFIVYPTLYDSITKHFDITLSGLDTINGAGLGNAGGYTIVNFIVMYCIGAYLRRFPSVFEKHKLLIILSYILSVLIIFLNQLFVPETALCYYNIFVVINAISIFLIFLQFNFSVPAINYVSKATLGVFCLHISAAADFLWERFNIQEACLKSGGVIINTIISVSVMTIICYSCDLLLQIIIKPIRNLMNKSVLYNKTISFEDSETGENNALSSE